MNTFAISVKIAERKFRLKVKPEEEERVRKAAKLIDEKIKDYSHSYAYNDMQDLLSMVVLQFAVKSLQCSDEMEAMDEMWGERLKDIEKVLTDHIE